MRDEFTKAITANQAQFGLELPADAIERLADYYGLILEHNPILHLVGPCTPEEFATRHILESLTMAKYLPTRSKFADIGTGGGLPAIPCLLVRRDLSAVLIESKEKKVGFLQKVLAECKLSERVTLVGQQFSEVRSVGFSYVSCRALDKFTQKLPQILRWSGNCTLILFGGASLRDVLMIERAQFTETLLPLSERRYVFVVTRGRRNR